MVKETPVRSAVKSITWRVLATIATISLVYIFTKEITLSLAIGGIEVVAKLILYYFHERVWDNIKLGRKNGQTR